MTVNLSTTFAFNKDEATEPTFLALKGFALGCLFIWTVIANALVFVVLYKNPRLQTVPNLLVGNLAFSDLCLGCIVLPLSAVYAVTLSWPFGKLACEIWISTDILSCTASIWNLSMIGLDRYWAITSPITYITKRNVRSAMLMILAVWALSCLISLAPFLGWRQYSEKGNYFYENATQAMHCQFLELPAYTLYSATGSFYIPLLVMFFVYFQIYRAFADHRARQIYRQKVIKKHIESTILHEISHVLPTSDEFAKDRDDDEEDEEDEDDDDDDESEDDNIVEEEEEDEINNDDQHQHQQQLKQQLQQSQQNQQQQEHGHGQNNNKNSAAFPVHRTNSSQSKKSHNKLTSKKSNSERSPLKQHSSSDFSAAARRGQQMNHNMRSMGRQQHPRFALQHTTSGRHRDRLLTYERVQKHKMRKEKRAMLRASLQKKPPAISAAKEKRGVKVLGIILGCFTICWFPFFVMYIVTGFCRECRPNAHIEQFITWLGYSNSAMNPIIYTVFNRDYQIALKKLFVKVGPGSGGSRTRRSKL